MINGLIAQYRALANASRNIPGTRVCRLNGDFGFLPLVEDEGPSDDPALEFGEFYRLTEPMAAWAKEQSHQFPIAYIETEYFGGDGCQGSWFGEMEVSILARSSRAKTTGARLRRKTAQSIKPSGNLEFSAGKRPMSSTHLALESTEATRTGLGYQSTIKRNELIQLPRESGSTGNGMPRWTRKIRNLGGASVPVARGFRAFPFVPSCLAMILP